MSRITALIYTLQINEGPPNEKSKGYLCAIARKSFLVTGILAETDRQAEELENSIVEGTPAFGVP